MEILESNQNPEGIDTNHFYETMLRTLQEKMVYLTEIVDNNNKYTRDTFNRLIEISYSNLRDQLVEGLYTIEDNAKRTNFQIEEKLKQINLDIIREVKELEAEQKEVVESKLTYIDTQIEQLTQEIGKVMDNFRSLGNTLRQEAGNEISSRINTFEDRLFQIENNNPVYLNNSSNSYNKNINDSNISSNSNEQWRNMIITKMQNFEETVNLLLEQVNKNNNSMDKSDSNNNSFTKISYGQARHNANNLLKDASELLMARNSVVSSNYNEDLPYDDEISKDYGELVKKIPQILGELAHVVIFMHTRMEKRDEKIHNIINLLREKNIFTSDQEKFLVGCDKYFFNEDFKREISRELGILTNYHLALNNLCMTGSIADLNSEYNKSATNPAPDKSLGNPDHNYMSQKHARHKPLVDFKGDDNKEELATSTILYDDRNPYEETVLFDPAIEEEEFKSTTTEKGNN